MALSIQSILPTWLVVQSQCIDEGLAKMAKMRANFFVTTVRVQHLRSPQNLLITFSYLSALSSS